MFITDHTHTSSKDTQTYVAFQHMTHKNPHTGHSATLIPSAV